MQIVDSDDFYSLTDYASQFYLHPNEAIDQWISHRSTLSIIELYETCHGSPCFRKSSVSSLLSAIDRGERLVAREVISTLSLLYMVCENDNIAAVLDIYYDFVQYLTERGINLRQ